MPIDIDARSRIQELEDEIRRLRRDRRYGLVWEDKQEAVVEQCRSELPVLALDPSRTIEADPDEPVHILIEGDNYPALSILAYTHARRVDVIYIDPPYNTGNRDFIYNDQFVDREDSYRHSKWLSFMSRRLAIARDLLSDTGVIFISIDDNEQAQLRLLCDEIFGKDNFVETIIWKRKRGKDNSAKHFSRAHEYLLVYAKSIEKCRFGRLEMSEKRKSVYSNPDNDPRGLYVLQPGWASGMKKGPTYNIDLGGNIFSERMWLYSKETLTRLFTEGRVSVKGKHKDGQPNVYIKVYLGEISGVLPDTLWDNVGNTGDAVTEIKNIFGDIVFNTPKPLEYIKRIIGIGGGANAIILDFFAGSGTTGQAVIELNREDGGTRQCILVTNNENRIAEDVTYPRLQSVIRGYGDTVGIPTNLRYYRTEFIPVSRSIDDLRTRFIGRSSEMLSLREGCYARREAVGWSEYFQVFENRAYILAIVYHPHDIEHLRILAKSTDRPIRAYIFSMGIAVFAEELAEFSGHLSIEAIPDAILETYRSIFGF